MKGTYTMNWWQQTIKKLNLKGEELQEDHKRDGEMLSGRKEHAKGPKPYSWLDEVNFESYVKYEGLYEYFNLPQGTFSFPRYYIKLMPNTAFITELTGHEVQGRGVGVTRTQRPKFHMEK